MQEVLVELNRQNKSKQDFISPAQGMRLREDGHTFEINHLTTSQQEVFGTTSLFHRQVASALGIPAKYHDLMQAQKPELLAENVNAWFADKPSSYMVRSMDYGAGQVARALLSERYRRIDNMEIATSVLPLFAGNDQYEVMSCEVTENRLYLKVVNHRLEMEVRKGDIVQAGVMISNSEVGLGAVSIQPLVYRLVCTNGMVVNDMGERRHHVGRQAKAVEDMDLWAEIGILDGGERLGKFIGRYREAYFRAASKNPATGVVYQYKPREGAEELIYQRISDITISMKALDYLNMPDCIPSRYEVEMNTQERELYDMLRKDLLIPLKDGDIDAANAASLTGKLLQMSNGAVYDENGKARVIHDHKLEALEDLIEAANGQPVLVAYWFKHDRERIMEHLSKQTIPVRDIKSSTDNH